MLSEVRWALFQASLFFGCIIFHLLSIPVTFWSEDSHSRKSSFLEENLFESRIPKIKKEMTTFYFTFPLGRIWTTTKLPKSSRDFVSLLRFHEYCIFYIQFSVLIVIPSQNEVLSIMTFIISIQVWLPHYKKDVFKRTLERNKRTLKRNFNV